MTNLRFNLLIAFLFIVLVFLQYRLWFEPGGMREMIQLKHNLSSQEEEIKRLRSQNSALLTEIQRLKHSNEATETRARHELGMIRKGETFYQVVK